MTVEPATDARTRPGKLLLAWYGATALFLLLDYGFGVNVRVAFFELHPVLKAGYYALCFLCLGLLLWQPGWSAVVGAAESLLSLVALILGFGIRVLHMTLPDTALVQPVLTPAEIANFLLAGFVGYYAWNRAMREVRATKRRR